MLEDYGITEEDLVIEEAQGYPRAYAKICRDFDSFPYRSGSTFTYMPYILQQKENPAVIRIDPYGNVLYFHADSASPLAWGFDHSFPCSRGGLTVPSNLRLVQWQARMNNKDKLEFLVPWWDLQVGISVNQFLSIFAASSSDLIQRMCLLIQKGLELDLMDGTDVRTPSLQKAQLKSEKT